MKTTNLTKLQSRPRRTLYLLSIAGLLLAVIYFWPRPTLYNPSLELSDLHLEPIEYETNFGETVTSEAGFLTVPENRSADNSNVIEIAFVRFKSFTESPGPPIFYLQGGPGTPGIPRAKGDLFRFFMSLRHYGDVILIDQRGIGQSRPSLDCDVQLDLDTDIHQDIKSYLETTLKSRFSECAEDLRRRGVDLRAYNTNESADDLNDLRKALGYESIVLLGYSYGTELAQVFIRRHESKVSKAILIGPVAPDQAYKLPSDFQDYFERIDSLLKADPRENKVMPNFLSTMREVHQQLDTQARFIQIPLLDAVDEDDVGPAMLFYKTISFFKPNWEMNLGDIHLQIMVANYVGKNVWTRRFPQFYSQLANGQFKTAGNWLRNFRRNDIGNAMKFAMITATGCSDERYLQAQQESEHAILSSFGIATVRQRQISAAWGDMDLGAEYREPIRSTIETLLIAGTLDGLTPLNDAKELQTRFPNSTLVTIENATHDELIGTRVIQTIRNFLEGNQVEDVVIKRPFYFFPIKIHQHSLQDSLLSIIDSLGIAVALIEYRSLHEKHYNTGDYIFEFEEYELNNLGYHLLQEERYKDAAAIFALNIESFPQRSNVYDSYAESLMLLGRNDEAIIHYQKSLAIDVLNNDAYQKLRELGVEIPY